jgi:hypothetical protein
MKVLNWLVSLYAAHGTKILGALTMIVAGLPQIDGLVLASHKPYWAAANLILGAVTIQRGVTNSRNAPPAA